MWWRRLIAQIQMYRHESQVKRLTDRTVRDMKRLGRG